MVVAANLAHHVRIQVGNRQHCQVSVLAVSANEECFDVCQFAFKSSATRRTKNGIVSIPCHRDSWHLIKGMPAIIYEFSCSCCECEISCNISFSLWNLTDLSSHLGLYSPRLIASTVG